jgi:preprotein translocase subunit Sec63
MNQTSRKFENNRLNIDMAELSIIKTILLNKESLDIVVDYCDENMFEVHKVEFNKAISNEDCEQIRAILLNDSIKTYSIEELKQQLRFFLIKFHENRLNRVLNDSSLDTREKSIQIRKAREVINSLKSKGIIL